MRNRVIGLAVGILAPLLLIATPASAATSQNSPPGCDAFRYDLMAGEGIAVTCDFPYAPPYIYRAVAHCAAGGALWYRPGFWVETGFGPSRAECQGGLLSSAQVIGYHVELG
jgi:hypothetical protein